MHVVPPNATVLHLKMFTCDLHFYCYSYLKFQNEKLPQAERQSCFALHTKLAYYNHWYSFHQLRKCTETIVLLMETAPRFYCANISLKNFQVLLRNNNVAAYKVWSFLWGILDLHWFPKHLSRSFWEPHKEDTSALAEGDPAVRLCLPACTHTSRDLTATTRESTCLKFWNQGWGKTRVSNCGVPPPLLPHTPQFAQEHAATHTGRWQGSWHFKTTPELVFMLLS